MTTTETITDRWGVSRPKTLADTMREKAAQVPKINGTTGKPRPIEEQPAAVQAVASVAGAPYEPPAPPTPSLGDTIVAVATEMRVDPIALLDDPAFVNAAAGLNGGDVEGVQQAIAGSGVRPPMRPNPAQGRSSTPPVRPETMSGKIARSVANSNTAGSFTALT
jgi:hypothetical protein